MASLAIALGIRQQANLDMPIQLTAAGQVIARHRFEFTMSRDRFKADGHKLFYPY
jgi:hypothetical protein